MRFFEQWGSRKEKRTGWKSADDAERMMRAKKFPPTSPYVGAKKEKTTRKGGKQSAKIPISTLQMRIKDYHNNKRGGKEKGSKTEEGSA